MTDHTFSELEAQMRETMHQMASIVDKEWQEFATDSVNKFEFTGDTEDQFKQLEDLSKLMRLEAAEQMMRSMGTWTGNSAYVSNAIEGIRHDAAKRIFETGASSMLYTAFHALKSS